MGHVSTWDDCRFSVLEQVKPLLSTHRLFAAVVDWCSFAKGRC